MRLLWSCLQQITCFYLTNKWMWVTASIIIPIFVWILDCTILISAPIVGFTSSPRCVWRISFWRGLPFPFLPLVSMANPTKWHETSDNITRLLVKDDRKIPAILFADTLSLLPIYLLWMKLVAIAISALFIASWTFWLHGRNFLWASRNEVANISCIVMWFLDDMEPALVTSMEPENSIEYSV